MSIAVLGGDGYIGWPLALRLALIFPTEPVLIADNYARRRLVKQLEADSLTPILPLSARIEAFQGVFGQSNLRGEEIDVSTPEVDAFIAEHRPRVIYHLAQQSSAAFSMSGAEESVFTLVNNEVGNLRLLWAVRRHCPGAHVIKMGSFGEYAKCGVDIAEGYFQLEYNGRKSVVPAPFPRSADDIYHASKINDTNYISVACRQWGLRVTDIMQSTIFGVHTRDTLKDDALVTRFDYDECFGTVANRFVVQTVAGWPMTVYGSGYQRTGLMALEDAVQSLSLMARETVKAGHRVLNHVTEKRYCVQEIAELIQRIASGLGYSPRIERGLHDPRRERPSRKMEYEIETNYLSARPWAPTGIDCVIEEALVELAPFGGRIQARHFVPRVAWQPSTQPRQAGEAVATCV